MATPQNQSINQEEPFFFKFYILYPNTALGRKDWSSRYSLNAYYAGKHWRDRAQDAEYWHSLVFESLCTGKYIGEKRLFDGKVELSFLFNDNLDCSNHSAMVKMIEDALRGVIIKDDSPKYVRGIYTGFHNKPYIAVTVKEVREEE